MVEQLEGSRRCTQQQMVSRARAVALRRMRARYIRKARHHHAKPQKCLKIRLQLDFQPQATRAWFKAAFLARCAYRASAEKILLLRKEGFEWKAQEAFEKRTNSAKGRNSLRQQTRKDGWWIWMKDRENSKAGKRGAVTVHRSDVYEWHGESAPRFDSICESALVS